MDRLLCRCILLVVTTSLTACKMDMNIKEINAKVDFSATTLAVTSPGVADGVTPVTITIIIRNQGIPVPSFIPSYTVSGSGNTIGTCSVSNAAGVSICQLRSTIAGTKVVSLANPVFPLTATVVFITPLPSTAIAAIASGGGVSVVGTVRRNASIGLPVTPIMLESVSAPGIPRARIGVQGVLYEP